MAFRSPFATIYVAKQPPRYVAPYSPTHGARWSGAATYGYLVSDVTIAQETQIPMNSENEAPKGKKSVWPKFRYDFPDEAGTLKRSRSLTSVAGSAPELPRTASGGRERTASGGGRERASSSGGSSRRDRHRESRFVRQQAFGDSTHWDHKPVKLQPTGHPKLTIPPAGDGTSYRLSHSWRVFQGGPGE